MNGERFRQDKATGEWTHIGPIGAAFQDATRAAPREAPVMIIDDAPVYAITTCTRWGPAGNPGGVVSPYEERKPPPCPCSTCMPEFI